MKVRLAPLLVALGLPSLVSAQLPNWATDVGFDQRLGNQLPLDAEFQVYTFAEETESLVSESDLAWVPIAEMEAFTQEASMLRMAEKWSDRTKHFKR